MVGYTRELPLSLVFAFTREQPEGLPAESPATRFVYGRLGPGLLQELFSGKEGFYLCGPEPFQQAVAHALR
ncbi:FAD/NAD-binding family oxidoreductase, partial [Oceanidesulfovibrio marinus]